MSQTPLRYILWILLGSVILGGQTLAKDLIQANHLSEVFKPASSSLSAKMVTGQISGMARLLGAILVLPPLVMLCVLAFTLLGAPGAPATLAGAGPRWRLTVWWRTIASELWGGEWIKLPFGKDMSLPRPIMHVIVGALGYGPLILTLIGVSLLGGGLAFSLENGLVPLFLWMTAFLHARGHHKIWAHGAIILLGMMGPVALLLTEKVENASNLELGLVVILIDTVLFVLFLKMTEKFEYVSPASLIERDGRGGWAIGGESIPVASETPHEILKARIGTELEGSFFFGWAVKLVVALVHISVGLTLVLVAEWLLRPEWFALSKGMLDIGRSLRLLWPYLLFFGLFCTILSTNVLTFAGRVAYDTHTRRSGLAIPSSMWVSLGGLVETVTSIVIDLARGAPGQAPPKFYAVTIFCVLASGGFLFLDALRDVGLSACLKRHLLLRETWENLLALRQRGHAGRIQVAAPVPLKTEVHDADGAASWWAVHRWPVWSAWGVPFFRDMLHSKRNHPTRLERHLDVALNQGMQQAVTLGGVHAGDLRFCRDRLEAKLRDEWSGEHDEMIVVVAPKALDEPPEDVCAVMDDLRRFTDPYTLARDMLVNAAYLEGQFELSIERLSDEELACLLDPNVSDLRQDGELVGGFKLRIPGEGTPLLECPVLHDVLTHVLPRATILAESIEVSSFLPQTEVASRVDLYELEKRMGWGVDGGETLILFTTPVDTPGLMASLEGRYDELVRAVKTLRDAPPPRPPPVEERVEEQVRKAWENLLPREHGEHLSDIDRKHFSDKSVGSRFTQARDLRRLMRLAVRQGKDLLAGDDRSWFEARVSAHALRSDCRYIKVATPGRWGMIEARNLPPKTQVKVVTEHGGTRALVVQGVRPADVDFATIIVGPNAPVPGGTKPSTEELVFTAHPGLPVDPDDAGLPDAPPRSTSTVEELLRQRRPTDHDRPLLLQVREERGDARRRT